MEPLEDQDYYCHHHCLISPPSLTFISFHLPLASLPRSPYPPFLLSAGPRSEDRKPTGRCIGEKGVGVSNKLSIASVYTGLLLSEMHHYCCITARCMVLHTICLHTAAAKGNSERLEECEEEREKVCV